MERDEGPRWLDHSIESEQALLGALLLNNDAHAPVSRLVRAEDFFEPVHAEIFRVIDQLVTAGKRATVILLNTLLPDVEIHNGLRMRQYLARLAAEATTIINAPDYARVVRELSDRRALREVAGALNPDDPTEAAVLATEAIGALDAVLAAHSSQQAPLLDMQAAMGRALRAAADAYQADGAVQGIPTGLRDLDVKLGGLSPGDLIVLAGRPGMGKSALLVTMLRLMATAGFHALLVSLEMGDTQLSHRMLSDYLFDKVRIPYSNLRSGRFGEQLFEYLTDAASQLAALPITIEQTPGLSMPQIAARARQLKRKKGLSVIAIDHLGLVKASSRYAGNKVNEIGEITGGAKALAKETDTVVILLSQLSREVEKRDDKRPTLADLRDSGSIEQDADMVLMLYRAAYYLQQREPEAGSEAHQKWMDAMVSANNKLDVIVAKQRHGATGTVPLFCDIAHNAARGLERGTYLPDPGEFR